jgi:hypothetical protein
MLLIAMFVFPFFSLDVSTIDYVKIDHYGLKFILTRDNAYFIYNNTEFKFSFVRAGTLLSGGDIINPSRELYVLRFMGPGGKLEINVTFYLVSFLPRVKLGYHGSRLSTNSFSIIVESNISLSYRDIRHELSTISGLFYNWRDSIDQGYKVIVTPNGRNSYRIKYIDLDRDWSIDPLVGASEGPYDEQRVEAIYDSSDLYLPVYKYNNKFTVDDLNDVVAFKYLGQGSIDYVRVYVSSVVGSPSIKVGIAYDYNGQPGAIINEGSLALSGSGWIGVNIPASLNVTQVYWIVISGLGVDANNYFKVQLISNPGFDGKYFYSNDLSMADAAIATSMDGGTTWSIDTSIWGVFKTDFGGAVKPSQAYADRAAYDPPVTYWFRPVNRTLVNSISFLLRYSGSIDVKIYNNDTGKLLAYNTSYVDTGTAAAVVKLSLNSTILLNPNVMYRIEVARISGTFKVIILFSLDNGAYTFGGRSYYVNIAGIDYPDGDLPFKFSGAQITNFTITSGAYYWANSTTVKYKYPFSFDFPAGSKNKQLKLYYPSLQTIMYLLADGSRELSQTEYLVQSYNSSHNVIILSDYTLQSYGYSYELWTKAPSAVTQITTDHTYYDPGDTITGQAILKDPNGNPINQSATAELIQGTSTVIRDLSGNQNHGTVYGGAQFINTTYGTAIELDGTDDYIEANTPNLLTFTLEVLFKANNISANGVFVSKTVKSTYEDWNYNFRIRYDKLYFNIYNNNTQDALIGSTVLSNNVWYHAVVTFDENNNTIMYLNGVVDGQKTFAVKPNLVNPVTTWIARYHYQVDAYAGMFNGSIALVRIYSRALTSSEITQNYYSVVYDNTTFVRDGLVLYLEFDNYVSGTVISSFSGSSVNGVFDFTLDIPSDVVDGTLYVNVWTNDTYSGVNYVTIMVSGLNITLSVSDSRIDVSSTAIIDVDVVYTVDGSRPSGQVYINGSMVDVLDGSGSYGISMASVGKWSFIVTAASFDGVNNYNSNSVSVIWDKVSITLAVVDDRIDVGSTANITVSAVYAYDNAVFSGTVNLNDSLTKSLVGKYYYAVANISDGLYGLTVFDSNIVYVVFDRIQFILSAADDRIDVGSAASIDVNAYYEYDNAVFNGTYSFNDTLTKNQVGKYYYTISSMIDNLYGLSVYQANTIYIIFDKLTVSMAANVTQPYIGEAAFINWTIIYQYDGQVVSSFNIEIYRNGSMVYSGNASGFTEAYSNPVKYRYTVNSIIDNQYGITVFDSNSISITWVKLNITIVSEFVSGSSNIPTYLQPGEQFKYVIRVTLEPSGSGLNTTVKAYWDTLLLVSNTTDQNGDGVLIFNVPRTLSYSVKIYAYYGSNNESVLAGSYNVNELIVSDFYAVGFNPTTVSWDLDVMQGLVPNVWGVIAIIEDGDAAYRIDNLDIALATNVYLRYIEINDSSIYPGYKYTLTIYVENYGSVAYSGILTIKIIVRNLSVIQTLNIPIEVLPANYNITTYQFTFTWNYTLPLRSYPLLFDINGQYYPGILLSNNSIHVVYAVEVSGTQASVNYDIQGKLVKWYLAETCNVMLTFEYIKSTSVSESSLDISVSASDTIVESGDNVTITVDITNTLPVQLRFYVTFSTPSGSFRSNLLVLDYNESLSISSSFTVPDYPLDQVVTLNIEVIIVDENNVQLTTSTIKIMVFNQAPRITLLEPPEGSTIKGNLTISFDIQDSSGISYVSYYIDVEGVWHNLSNPYEIFMDTRKYANGRIIIIVRAVDIHGNMNQQSFYFYIDNPEMQSAFYQMWMSIGQLLSRWIFIPGVVTAILVLGLGFVIGKWTSKRPNVIVISKEELEKE